MQLSASFLSPQTSPRTSKSSPRGGVVGVSGQVSLLALLRGGRSTHGCRVQTSALKSILKISMPRTEAKKIRGIRLEPSRAGVVHLTTGQLFLSTPHFPSFRARIPRAPLRELDNLLYKPRSLLYDEPHLRAEQKVRVRGSASGGHGQPQVLEH